MGRVFVAGFTAKLFSLFLSFWFIVAPKKLFASLVKLLLALEHFLSLTLMIKTFFRPWKNETRPGYYFYAILVAASAKLLLIVADFVILLAVLVLGAVLILGFVSLPVTSLVLIFTGFL